MFSLRRNTLSPSIAPSMQTLLGAAMTYLRRPLILSIIILRASFPKLWALNIPMYGKQPIHFAAQAGDIEQLKSILRQGINIETQDNSGDTPLHIATIQGKKDAIILLIGFGADINVRNNCNNKPFIYDYPGAFFGLLSRYVADQNLNHDGEPELHRAIRLDADNNELERILAEYKQNSPLTCINQLDIHKQTALDVALVTRSKAILFLLAHGADPLRGLYTAPPHRLA